MPHPALKKAGRGLATPIGRALAGAGVSANAVTAAGLVAAAACGLFLARGRWIVALLFLVASALCDMLDGAVARAKGGGGSRMGAALDSTFDRYGEAVILAGVLVDAWTRETSPWFVWLWVAALVASFLVSYVRARAEGLGLSCEVGLLERPERMALLGLLCILGPRAAVPILGILAVLGHVTIVQRLLHVRRAARSAEREGP